MVVGPVDEVEQECSDGFLVGGGIAAEVERIGGVGGQGGVHADAGGFLLQADGFDQRGQTGRHPVEDGAASFVHLELLPAFALVGVGVEDEGVAADEFVGDGVEDVGGREAAFFVGYLGVEEEVHEEVAEFFFEFGVERVGGRAVGRVGEAEDGFAEFVGFLDGEVAQALDGLDAVPRALAAQDVEGVAEAL